MANDELRYSPAELTFVNALELLSDLVCPNYRNVPIPSEAIT